MSPYLITTSNGEALKDRTIHDPKTKLKIKVFDLLKSRFNPRKGEITYFVTAGNETLAFETKGYKKHRKMLILQIILWYCIYLRLLEAHIHSNWPL
jgi:hypothetical protein